MKPNVFVLFGSPRHNGYTACMLKYFFSCWDEIDAVVFDAYKENIKPCIHCGYCKKVRGCIYNDFIPVEKGLNNADVLIIASPVYELSFPSPLKAVFDRTQQYFEAKFSLGIQMPIQKHKAALLFASYGSTDSSGVEIMQKQLALAFRVMNAELLHTVVSANTDNERDFDKNLIYSELDKASQKLKQFLYALP
ncbi:MAG: flavodoxin family protein [Spirochaetaceae bacterium]|jgi:multimeric flavodoxin WrbA|nr:flavodoxin family protein [Spirochaetaceae bacterium]